MRFLKSKVCLFVVLAGLGIPALGKENALTDKEIEQALKSFLIGAARNDIEAHESFWADELVYTSSTGRRFGKAQLLNDLLQSAQHNDPATNIEYKAVDTHIQYFDGAAVLTFQLVSVSEGNERRYFNSGVLIKREGRWQVVNWHATLIP